MSGIYYTPIGIIRERQSWFFALLTLCLFLIAIYNLEIPKPILVYQTYYKVVRPENQLYCHLINALDTLPVIDDEEVKKDESIFFLESSCTSYFNSKILIKARQACAVESAALMNPNKTVYLLYASPGKFYDDKTESDRLIKNLMSLPNVKILHFDVDSFIKGTPVEKLWTTGQIKKSKYEVAHTSDILRLLTLWKYGGIYLDLDVIVMKSLQNMPSNFAGAESMTDLANGVLGFSSKGLGHQHVNSCLNDIADHYNGDYWSYNGPKAIGRMLHTVCETKDITQMINTSCQEFHIFPPGAFYPIYWTAWAIFFDETKLDYVQKKSQDSYLIHVWNKLSFDEKIPLYKNVPYLDFARIYCPGTVHNLEEYF